MSGYRGRLNVNVSHFLADLNTIPSAEEQVVDNFNPDDLSIFTNTQFFDFDMGEPLGDFSSNGSYNGATTKSTPKQETLQKQHFEEHNAIDCFLGGMQISYFYFFLFLHILPLNPDIFVLFSL